MLFNLKDTDERSYRDGVQTVLDRLGYEWNDEDYDDAISVKVYENNSSTGTKSSKSGLGLFDFLGLFTFLSATVLCSMIFFVPHTFDKLVNHFIR